MSRRKTITSIDARVDNLYHKLNDMAQTQVIEACRCLDELLAEIGDSMQSEMPDNTLHYYIIELANQLYFAVSKQEELGIKEDVAKLIRQEVYNESRQASVGTVAERDAKALLDSQYEEIVQIVYSRAYKKVKAKVDAGYEMLNALKKVMNARLAELELSRSRYIGGNNESRSNN